jgi:predicted DsbA family dithiol-disulfide isomerase
MQPVLDKFLAENPDINYTKYDADENVATFQEYGITGVPAFVIKSPGSEDKFHKGLATQDKLQSLFN